MKPSRRVTQDEPSDGRTADCQVKKNQAKLEMQEVLVTLETSSEKRGDTYDADDVDRIDDAN